VNSTTAMAIDNPTANTVAVVDSTPIAPQCTGKGDDDGGRGQQAQLRVAHGFPSSLLQDPPYLAATTGH
jgi:hypothetical protein